MSRLFVPSFRDVGFSWQRAEQVLQEIGGPSSLVRGWSQDGLRSLLSRAESADVKYGSLNVDLAGIVKSSVCFIQHKNKAFCWPKSRLLMEPNIRC